MTDSAHSPADPARRKDAAAPADGHAMPAVVAQTLGGLSAEGLRQFFARESARFTAQRLETRAALRAGADAYMGGVPMHWMRDWPLPYPLVITRANDAHLTDMDGFEIDDFCLGDGAAPFGHTPEPVVKAIRKQAERGISFMLPTRKALEAGAALTDFYGDFRWQIALSATDANRNVIKVARAVTRREKVLVFNGSYHGAVDDVMVRGTRGRIKQRRGLVGQVHDLRRGGVAVEFNDLAAVEAVLATGDVAAILTEPVMTRAGVVMPADGFLAGLRALATRYEAVLIFDESQTHTAARGGFARDAGVTPDVLVIGKGVAGGMPAAIWGVSDDIAGRFAAYDALRAAGDTGMGSSLAGNALQAVALLATLTEVATPKAFAKMDRSAARLAAGLTDLFARFSLPWHVTRVGGRVAFTCAAQPVTNGTEAAAAAMPAIERAIHIGLLNRGCLISPYHNAMLVTPVTSKVQIARLLTAFEDVLFALAGATHALAEDSLPQAIAGDTVTQTLSETGVTTGDRAVVAEDAQATDSVPSTAVASRAVPTAVVASDAVPAPMPTAAVPSAQAPAQAAAQAPAQDSPAPRGSAKPAPRRGWWAGSVQAEAKPAPASAVTQTAVPVVAKAPVAPAPKPKTAAPQVPTPAKPAPAGGRKGWWKPAAQAVDTKATATTTAVAAEADKAADAPAPQAKSAAKPAAPVAKKAAAKPAPKAETKPKAKAKPAAKAKPQPKDADKTQAAPKNKAAAAKTAKADLADTQHPAVTAAQGGAQPVADKAPKDGTLAGQTATDAPVSPQARRGWWKKA